MKRLLAEGEVPRTSLIAAVAIILLANLFAILHGVRNRLGPVDAEVTLTRRELWHLHRPASDDDSGVTLRLNWTDPNSFFPPVSTDNPLIWLDRSKLTALGFDCRMDPSSKDAGSFYQRQQPRQVYAAFEFNGRTWRAWVASNARAAAEQKSEQKDPARVFPYMGNTKDQSRLIAIDADLNPDTLRARHPDRQSVIIVPAVVAMSLDYYSGNPNPPRPPRILGRIQQIQTSIHVPRPYSDGFRNPHIDEQGPDNPDGTYRVKLRYGASHEPWVAGVEFISK